MNRSKTKWRTLIAGAAVVAPALWVNAAHAVELVIGEERVKPGVVFIFEGAVKDHISPAGLHLSEIETHVHIEARVNWSEDEDQIPAGAPPSGFIPYLHITAKVTNQKTGLSTFVDLLPHINLIDNFHYARNISLPGNPSDPYTVRFSVTKPTTKELALHKDWLDKYGSQLLPDQIFEYKDVDFEEIVAASRR